MGYLFSFDMFGIVFSFMFMFVFGLILVRIISGIGQWNKNNHSPRLTVAAKVVAKRTNVTHHHHNGTDGVGHSHADTTYYVTFEVQSTDRMEFHVTGREYGLLVEGDIGMLSFQGTRYLGFERQ